jgi:predicted alpha/beta superfamily hydrolase
LGLITAWYFNAIAVLKSQDYLEAWFGSEVDLVLSWDLTLVAVAGVTLMIIEAKRLKMKRVWAYLAASGLTAMAFTFPLFLAMRELKLEKQFLAGGRIDKFEIDGHKIEVWVPKVLYPHTPILVMHDGRNVFNPESAFHGDTWGVLEALETKRITADPQPLVVAVWGLGDETRMLELAPEEIVMRHPDIWDPLPIEYKPTTTTPLNKKYQELLALKLIPMVLEKYGIEHQLERTAIAGSSMGGLASIHAMASYPEVWGAALCFSTHWILGHEYMVEELVELVPKAGRHKIYTDTGTEGLDLFYPPFHEKALKLLAAKGYRRDRDLTAAIFPGTAHNEKAWASRIHHPINWWLQG